MPQSLASPAALGLAAILLSGCLVATPDDMQVPSPDGQYVLEVAFTGGGLTLRPGLGAELALRHASGASSPLASLEAVRRLEIAWSNPRTLRICAPDAEAPQGGPVVVETPAGPETFLVSYACPAQAVLRGQAPTD
ncbi:MAG: hypothetical protein Q8L59_06465 [Phenylobacterium sp.]|uniref:hypothetical protein n=1 Tax=Phenylobacterium sp. TaxID=1871053 RepID=UPI002733330D|nr:hypothetical protein [Phenylobacterium sp.]MDP1641811.1 hypothetical protein [Phenylobacterium sp.]MDP3117368.1 hypothetical protein [Phenylobacterium sp.]MDP3385552.1 hypothetical protein [Phenylobacterium sp.]